MSTQENRSKTAREMAAEKFAKGDRVRTPDGREGTVNDVNEYAAAVVSITIDGKYNLSPWLFYDLTNISREAIA